MGEALENSACVPRCLEAARSMRASPHLSASRHLFVRHPRVKRLHDVVFEVNVDKIWTRQFSAIRQRGSNHFSPNSISACVRRRVNATRTISFGICRRT